MFSGTTTEQLSCYVFRKEWRRQSRDVKARRKPPEKFKISSFKKIQWKMWKILVTEKENPSVFLL